MQVKFAGDNLRGEG